MADEYGTIAAAIVSKFDTDVSELRDARRTRRQTGALPRMRVLPPSFVSIDGQSATLEEFTLTFPFEVRVSMEGQRDRADVVTTRLMRALQVSWQSGVKLSQPTLIWHSQIDSMEPVAEFEDDGMSGFTGVIRVECREVISGGRTA